MQIKFLSALLLLGGCFAQVTFAHPQQTIIDVLISKAEQAIETIQSIIKISIDDAVKTCNGSKDQVNDLGQVGNEDAKKNLNKVVASAQKRIDAIKKKSEEIGVDISACLTDNDNCFKNLFNKFLQDEISCITNEIDEALNIINGAIKIATNDWNTVEDLPEKLVACGTSLTSIICINQVIVEVATLQVDLPSKIAQKVTEVTVFVAGLKVRVGICAASQVAKAGIEAAGVVADVAACATTKSGKNIFGNF